MAGYHQYPIILRNIQRYEKYLINAKLVFSSDLLIISVFCKFRIASTKTVKFTRTTKNQKEDGRVPTEFTDTI